MMQEHSTLQKNVYLIKDFFLENNLYLQANVIFEKPIEDLRINYFKIKLVELVETIKVDWLEDKKSPEIKIDAVQKVEASRDMSEFG